MPLYGNNDPDVSYGSDAAAKLCQRRRQLSPKAAMVSSPAWAHDHGSGLVRLSRLGCDVPWVNACRRPRWPSMAGWQFL
jgi:hypothetical protein